MESELNRSVRMLEDALAVPGTSVFKKGLFKAKKNKTPYKGNVSLTYTPEELDYINEGHSPYASMAPVMNNTISTFINKDMTATGAVLEANHPWENTINNLYIEFLEISQSHTNSQGIMEMVADLACCCADTLNVIKALKSKVTVQQTMVEDIWLQNEHNTWKLIYALYQDRINIQSMQSEDDQYNQYFGLSEKLCMLNLFKREPIVRETQLVIDWLECNSAEKDDDVLHYSDSTVGWENTLHQLKSKETIVFPSSREIVTQLDPDAPYYQNRPLHDLDIEDEKKLCRAVFTGIRCGKLNEAQKLCSQCGHSWRAALLEGWKLHHDPKMDNENEMSDEMAMVVDKSTGFEEMEGNENRDLWKIMALKYCEQIQLNKHEKAVVAAYCGYLRHIIPCCNDWNDYLWAYLKVMIDIRVESEIRDCVNRKYHDLPEFYWNQKMSLNDIFSTLEASKNRVVSSEAQKPEYVIQKYLILDDMVGLFKVLDKYVEDGNVSTQFLRFATHLLLFFEQVGRVQRRDIIEKVLELYVCRLMDMDDIQLVAYYVSKMSSQKQVQLYSSYLERVVDDSDRQESLKYAENCDLNINLITKKVVENIRNKPFDVGESSLQQKLTADDEYKISAIDWLLYYESHRPEALIQSNAMLFKFLTLRKLDAAQLLFNKIPSDSVDKILAEGEVDDYIKQGIKEHLSYKSYLDAQEAFNVWFKHFKSKPVPPESISENAHLTEKVAHQHRMSQFKAETERWKLTISHLARSAKTLLYNVLLFPDGGWLNDAVDADYLKSTCIPECVLLLATVLYESKLLNECIQLADILASEKYGLYRVYNTQRLEEIVTKLTECSVALLEEKKDPWGNDTAL